MDLYIEKGFVSNHDLAKEQKTETVYFHDYAVSRTELEIMLRKVNPRINRPALIF